MAADRLAGRAATLLVLVNFGLSRLAAFGVVLVVARTLERDLAGTFLFITGLAALGAIVAPLGINTAAAYYYQRNVGRNRRHRNRQILRVAALLAVPACLVISLFALTVAEIREGGDFAIVYAILVLCMLFATARQIARGFLLAEGHRASSALHESLIYNGLLLALLPLAPPALMPLLGVLLVASAISGVAALLVADRSAGGGTVPGAAFPPLRYGAAILALSLPSMVAQGGALILNRIDVLLIGPLAGPADIADFNVVFRLTYLVSSVPELLVYVMGPRLMQRSAAAAPVAADLTRSIVLSSAIVLAVSLPLLVFPGQILELLFGPSYGHLGPTLVVLLAGKMLTAAFGPAVILFTSLGLNRRLARVAILAAVVDIALGLALIPRWGAFGAAIATTVALAILAANYSWLTWSLARGRLARAPRAGSAA